MAVLFQLVLTLTRQLLQFREIQIISSPGLRAGLKCRSAETSGVRTDPNVETEQVPWSKDAEEGRVTASRYYKLTLGQYLTVHYGPGIWPQY